MERNMIANTEKINFYPFSLDDGQAVVDLFNANSRAVLGVNNYDMNELMNDWTSPNFNPAEMAMVVKNEQSKIIGYADVWDTSDPHVTKYVYVVLHPEIWNESLHHEMLSWAEELSRKRIALAPAGTKVTMRTGVAHKDKRSKKALASYGFEIVRQFYLMKIELDNKPQTPQVPKGLRIEPIVMETELTAAIIAMDEAFQDHWGHVQEPFDQLLEEWRHYLENDADFDPALWFLAKDGDEIAGFCRCSPKTVEDPNMGWVNQLGVRKPWRKRGLGMALLLWAFNTFYQQGKARVGLGVDADSLTNATRLYEKAGMHVSRQYDTYQKVIRPGKDLVKK
jgi:mycothiol synthase